MTEPNAVPGSPSGSAVPSAREPRASPPVGSSSAGGAPAAPVAIVGDPYAALGLVRALAAQGVQARFLCSDDRTAQEFLRPLAPGSTEHVSSVLGTVDSDADLARLLEGAGALAFLVPLGEAGRTWRPETHLEDAKRILACARSLRLPRIAYLSSLGANRKAKVECLREAAEIEPLVEGSAPAAYCLRAGPVVGRGDPLLARALRQGAHWSPFAVILGYGDVAIQPIHVDDLGLCLARCLTAPATEVRPGVYQVAGPDVVSLIDLVDRAAARRRRHKAKVHVPLFVVRPAALFGYGRAARFATRVQLLPVQFGAEKNDLPELLGPAHAPRTIEQALSETPS